MTKKERREYILNIDTVVKRWRDKSNLFAGGCCFSAGQIAKLLEKKKIRYKVVCWQVGDTEIKLKNIIKHNDCAHVGIQVSLDGKRFIIGGDYYSHWVTSVITYNRIKSKEIIEYDLLGVKIDTWNYEYNRQLNNRFINILNKAVSK